MNQENQEKLTPATHMEAINEIDLGKTEVARPPFLIRHRKKLFFIYALLGVGLFCLMLNKPELKTPYLIEIFNR